MLSSKKHESAFPSTSSTKSPVELLTIENLSSQNDLLKGKVREMEFELQRTKEENPNEQNFTHPT